jgi:hypothetical protein
MRGSRPVAIPLLPKLKTELDSLEDQLVICKVVDPTEWVHPIVIAPKKDGGIRVCVDFTHLNNFIIRPMFETATPSKAVRTIPAGMKFFTVIDALKGFHQVPLDDESAAMTTFSTPFGRYMYRRLPFGICHAGDDYSRRVSAVFDDLFNCRCIIEDILIFSETYEEHVALVRQVFQRAADHQITINTRKIQFAQPSVLFGGYILSSTGFSPSRATVCHQQISSPYEHLRYARVPRPLPTDGQLLPEFSSCPSAARSPPQEKLPVGMDITPRILLQ